MVALPRHAATLLAVLALAAAAVAAAPAPVDAGVDDAAVASAPLPSLVGLDNTTNHATPDVVTRRELARADVDVAAAVGVGAARLHARHDSLTFTQRLRSARPAGRLDVTRRAIDAVDARISALDDRQASLFRAYSNGTLSTDTLLRRLAVIEAAATEQSALVDRIQTRADASPGVSLPVELEKEIANLRASLVLLPSPSVERVAEAVSGTAAPITMYLEGAEQGFVVSMIADGTYLREATLRSERRPTRPNRFERRSDPRNSTITVAYRFAGTLYPWTFANAIGAPSIRGFGETSVYLVEANHPQGDLRTYIDGSTRSVFREQQSKRPGAVPVTDQVATQRGSLAVRVNTTAASGPAQVTVTRPETGARVNATVSVAYPISTTGGNATRYRVGSTGDDGQLWTVQPAGSFRVTAVTGARNVSVLVG